MFVEKSLIGGNRLSGLVEDKMSYKIKKDPVNQIPKFQFAFWVLVRVSMILCAAYSFFIEKDMVMGFESFFCFIFSHLWDMFQVFGNGSFIEDVPPLSQTMLNFIIFVGIVFGSYFGLFDKVSWFDNLTHFNAGLVCAVFGYDFAFIIQHKKGSCAPTLAAIFGLMFALSIAVGWEFYEYAMDTLHGTNLQLAQPVEGIVYDPVLGSGFYGLKDTMTDLIMNTIGGLVGMVGIILYRKKHPVLFKK